MDLEILETGNGGDLVKTTKGLSVIEGFENMPYLAMFGGNTEASTPSRRIESEQDFSWWGNSLMPNESSIQMNSITERRLLSVALNSAGRIQIEQAVKKDLEFMKPFANVKEAVSIIGIDRVLIAIQIYKPNNLERKQYIYIWDATLKELQDRSRPATTGAVSPDLGGVFDEYFDESFE